MARPPRIGLGRGMKMSKPAPTPGAPGSNPSMPFSAPGASSQPYGHTGGLLSPVAGRTDHIPVDVPNGAYVLPADVISGMGQGNTLHGIGGDKGGGTVPIMATGGEYIIPPEVVTRLGRGKAAPPSSGGDRHLALRWWQARRWSPGTRLHAGD
jgi:hypothetical protein